MESQYGTQIRPWPRYGYFRNYQHLLSTCFDVVEGKPLLVEPSGDEGEVWRWSFGFFSWTPDGDLWEQIQSGLSATRSRAEAECRRALVNYHARIIASRESVQQ